jgi:hypothetical protein
MRHRNVGTTAFATLAVRVSRTLNTILEASQVDFGESIRLTALLFILAVFAAIPTHAQSSDDDLRVYAVGIINVAPFKMPFSGYGVYLGQSVVITAAHVVGHWPLFTNPTIIIGDREIPAKVIKKGSFPQLDLAQLSVEQTSLPDSARLRQNSLCKGPAQVGTDVVVVSPERTERSRIVSSQAIPLQYRSHFDTLISEPHVSGSAVFNADKKCLIGIMSAAITRYGRMGAAVKPYSFQTTWDTSVGYFVPASTIADFLPAQYRF